MLPHWQLTPSRCSRNGGFLSNDEPTKPLSSRKPHPPTLAVSTPSTARVPELRPTPTQGTVFHHSSTPTLASMGFPGPFGADSAAGRGTGLGRLLLGWRWGALLPLGLLPGPYTRPSPEQHTVGVQQTTGGTKDQRAMHWSKTTPSPAHLAGRHTQYQGPVPVPPPIQPRVTCCGRQLGPGPALGPPRCPNFQDLTGP